MIHQYKSNGYNIVLDINSGSVHVVDDLVYDVLEQMQKSDDGEEISRNLEVRYPLDEIREAVKECEELKRQGMLFTCLLYTSPSPRDRG